VGSLLLLSSLFNSTFFYPFSFFPLCSHLPDAWRD
jgi:hypothetical protein